MRIEVAPKHLANPIQDILLTTCAFIALVVALTASPTFAHPGRTAADGCHYCRTNCDKWGEIEGARHCHGQTDNPPPPPPVIVKLYHLQSHNLRQRGNPLWRSGAARQR